MSSVVIVESPAKAKTINKYLGKDFTVLASYGHVRDLPPKDGSVRPDEDFAMSWEIHDRAGKRLKEIAEAVKGATHLYLATDPDREGEAISWHVQEILNQRKALKGVDVKRVVFNEVTKSAVLDAFKHPRELNRELIDAYMARRALDYLVGFTLSPVLWRKLPGSRSAGRVQSVALRLICERETEIEAFKPREYWSVEAEFTTASGDKFIARLTQLAGKKLDKFDLANAEQARAAADAILKHLDYAVASVEKKQIRRNPPPPFTTSTLQQEASRKLGFGAARTMRTAQRLYEGVDIGGETVGLITYMRTDGVTMANEAIAAARDMVTTNYGREYLPDQPRVYTTKAANAQEAHEAIRPTDMHRRPEDLPRHIDTDERALYDLVWKRAVASQMSQAVFDQVAVDLAPPDSSVTLRATGQTEVFSGFLKLYHEDEDDPGEDEENRRLPALSERDALKRGEVKPEQHFTLPPPRYTEASLVKKLEELGIGRPSTYASTLQVLQDRKYVRLDQKRLIPEDRGRLVTAFLVEFFEHYFEYSFTADLERKLDDISDGKIEWKQVLADFWKDFSAAVAGTKDLNITQVIDALDEELGAHFFPPRADGTDPRLCPLCSQGRLGLKLGRFGAFVGCSRYPECRYTRPLAVDSGDTAADFEPKLLGNDPNTGLPVTARKGPYGPYVQLGDTPPRPPKPPKRPKGVKRTKEEIAKAREEKAAAAAAAALVPKPKRASIPKDIVPAEVDLEKALRLLALPREIGAHPSDGAMIYAGIGRFGPYIKHNKDYKSLTADDDVLTVGLNRAVSLLAEPKKFRRGAPEPIKVLGDHPSQGGPVKVYNGKYGPYVSHEGVNATLPNGMAPEELTMERAVELLAERAARGGGRKGRATKGPRAKKTSKKKETVPAAE